MGYMNDRRRLNTINTFEMKRSTMMERRCLSLIFGQTREHNGKIRKERFDLLEVDGVS